MLHRLVDVVHRHPLLVLVIAAIVAFALIAYAADVFVGWADREDPVAPR